MYDMNKDFEYYLSKQEEFVAKFDGKVIVIRNQQLLGSFDNTLEAVTETRKHYELGSFLVQRCSAGKKDYTGVFHSRVR